MSVSTNNEPKPFLQSNQNTIYFSENWEVGIGGGLWSTGLSLSKLFLHQSNLLRLNIQRLILTKKNSWDGVEESENCKHKIKALELGSGNGLLSCCLASTVGDLLDELVVTDLADHLDLMRQTVNANSHFLTLQTDEKENKDREDNSNLENVKCYVTEHTWGEFDDISTQSKLLGKFDFIFGSDVAYRDYLHDPLISSLDRLSHENTIILIGVTMTDTKPIFFSSLRKAGFRYERIPDHLMSEEFRGATFGLFVIQRDRKTKN
mmetsp:Transcript_29869/g.34701  ORF Transcript_29869/g.34701 Transcript_29869/m.34701 type:complete len:263 (-) Transcript_29869:2413-3201(-)